MGAAIQFEKLHNVRDLGGIAAQGGRFVRDGRLLRGGQLFSATENDLQKLIRLGVRKVVDFRSIGEHDEKPDPPLHGAQYVYLPIIEDVGVGITRGDEGNKRMLDLLASGGRKGSSFIGDHMRNMYRGFIRDEFANAQYARFVDEVIATVRNCEAVFWHCTGGKDRAGFAAVILLGALGASPDDIMADYLQTNDNLADVGKQLLMLFGENLPEANAVGTDFGKAIERFFVADESYLAAAYEEAAKTCGSFDSYLEKRLHIDSAKRQELCNLLLEG